MILKCSQSAWSSADNSGGSGVGKYQVLFSNTNACSGTPADIANVSKMEFVADSANPYFCIRAIDRVGNPSGWSTASIGSVEVETYYHSFGGVTAVERRDANNNEDLAFTVTDALGSADLSVRSDGTMLSNVRYLPFGQERWIDVDAPSDKGFTGQRNEAGFGLVDYNARYFDPYLYQMTQPDSIIPDSYNPIDWNRYAYARYNPVRYTDSSGHCIDGLTTVPCLLALIAVTGFAGGAAIYEFNVSGNSWWESSEDALATAQAGFDGALLAVGTALTAGEAVLLAPEAAMYLGSKTGNTQMYSWGATQSGYLTPYAELEIDSGRMPNIASNIKDAQSKGAPSILTRTTDPARIKANRDAACAGFCGPGSPDEYPFASTYEGGAGAFVKGVPLNEQKIQGGVINNFYRRNNIRDGDKFRVTPR